MAKTRTKVAGLELGRGGTSAVLLSVRLASNVGLVEENCHARCDVGMGVPGGATLNEEDILKGELYAGYRCDRMLCLALNCSKLKKKYCSSPDEIGPTT